MRHTEQYQSMETKFRREAKSKSNPMMRDRLLTQADGWGLLVKASRYISEIRAKEKLLSDASSPLAASV